MHNSLTRRFVLALVLTTLSGTIAHACDDNPSSNSPNCDGNRSSADIAECRDSHPDSAPNAPVTYLREGCYLVARVGDLTNLDLLLWVAGFFGHLALLLTLLLRKRARMFPVFTTLIVLNVTRTIVLFLINREGTKATYFYTFWSLAFADVALQFGVVYELASKVFRPLGEWASDIRTRLAVLVACSIGFALLPTWIPHPQSRFWMQVIPS
jgi:hypothetical protein